jgi:hypothetical protein
MTSEGNNTYQWDAEGRMVSVNGGSTWSATYNAFGQRVDSLLNVKRNFSFEGGGNFSLYR